MSCPTCDGTMARVNEGVNPKVWWCARCGTIKSEPGVPEYEQPMLIRRVLKARCRMSSQDLVQGGIDDCLPLGANQLGGDTKIIVQNTSKR